MNNLFLATLLCLYSIAICGNLTFESKNGALSVNGQRLSIKGASWFGFETGGNAVHGLWQVDYKSIIDFMANNNFNAARIPFSLDLVINNPNPNVINYGTCPNDPKCNLDLQGLTSLQVLDKIIAYMGTKGILVMLDMHSFGPDAASSNGLWFDSTHSEALVIQGWKTLASRYQNYWNVFAMDIKNEPFSATWGTGNTATDFNLAAQRIANNIISTNNWLVFVQGITCASGCFWGQNLAGVKNNPVNLNVPNRVVYSPHVYGPDVYGMSYFNDATFPQNMPAIWEQHFGFIRNSSTSAVVTGQWGGSASGKNGIQMNAYADYLISKNMTDNFFWCINPNSGDTGGLLLGDWSSPDTAKLSILARVTPSPTNMLKIIGSNTTTNNTNTNNTNTNSTNSTNNTSTNSSCGNVVYTSEQSVLKINGQHFYLKGASWFGFETGSYTVHGLWQVDYKFIVDFLASNNFNAVRLPLSLDLITNNPNPTSINYGSCSNNANCNVDLKGLTSLQIMDKIIAYMGTKGIVVMLDMHSFQPDAHASNGYWFDSTHSEAAVIQGWKTLASRYQNYWNVFAMDVKNEPFSCTWGTGNIGTDFNLAAERIGNAVISNNNWLVFVEGVSCDNGCFWGQGLTGVQTKPVSLNIPNRVVYSPHVYGPGVYVQSYFNDATYPANMPSIWNQHFGYIKNLNGAAVVTGQWGGISTSATDVKWMNAFGSYLKSTGMTDNFFWCVNPNSGDTGGLLLNDWVTPDTVKLALLANIVPNPTKVLSIIQTTCNSTNSTNSTNSSNCGVGQTLSATKTCINCSVFSCEVCSSSASVCDTCLPTLYSYPDGSFCQLCLLATNYVQCRQSSCSDFFWFNKCISNCSAIINTNPSQPTPIDGTCLCKTGYVWSNANPNSQCVPCSSYSVTKSQCASAQCGSNYFWSIVGSAEFCTDCLGIGATIGPNNLCVCPTDTAWDASSNYCYSCRNGPLSLCGVGSCSNYFINGGIQCLPCGPNNVNRAPTTPLSVCNCAAGYTWVNNKCTACLTNQRQYLLNNVCYNCPITKYSLMNSSTPRSNSTVCLCIQNYQFILASSTMQCTCDNTQGLFDKNNSLGCAPCKDISPGLIFSKVQNSCVCVSPLVLNAASQKCGCPTAGTYFKYNKVCAPCSETPTNAGVNPNSILSCSCSSITVWNSSYSSCVCKGTNRALNQYFNGSTCVVCGTSTLGIIDGYNRCLCPANTLWNPQTFTCVCNNASIPINKICTPCSNLPNALAPSSLTSCACVTGWTWSSTTNTCQCNTVTCSCTSVPNTAFSVKTKNCQPCSTFGANANPSWLSGQKQCSCKGSFQWTLNSTTNVYSCVCPSYSPSNPVLKIGLNCVLCGSRINSLNSGGGSVCTCFPNYSWSSTFLVCSFTTKSATTNVQFLNGKQATCTNSLTSAVSKASLDNYNCACLDANSIFNDLTGSCQSCPLGRVNAVTCKCPTGQDWNIFMMTCISTKPPQGQYSNPYYTKCIQSPGLSSSNLIAYTPSDSGLVYVSGEYDFIALASKSALYANWAAFKCNCASGFGWNAVRKRCYPSSYSYKY